MTVLLSVVAAGFLVGTRAEWPHKAGYHLPAGDRGPGLPARSYSELREGSTHPNQEIYTTARSTLIGLLPSLGDPVAQRTPEDAARALAKRHLARAFDGAPPTVPHRMDPRAEPNCLVCHEQGAKIGALIAPMLSHAPFSNCVQCHVERVSPQVVAALVEGDNFANGFEPLEFGGRGSRAWQGAPPVVPHSSFMRQRCESCHGVTGALGLKTPHPARQACTQCHVLNAELEQNSPLASRLDPPKAPAEQRR